MNDANKIFLGKNNYLGKKIFNKVIKQLDKEIKNILSVIKLKKSIKKSN